MYYSHHRASFCHLKTKRALKVWHEREIRRRRAIEEEEEEEERGGGRVGRDVEDIEDGGSKEGTSFELVN